MDDLIRLLHLANSASSHSPSEQRALILALTKFNALPDASFMYLALFVDVQQPASLRGMSGLLLKNLLRKSNKKIQPEFIDKAVNGILPILQNAEQEASFVISTAATILAVLVDKEKSRWQAMLHLLLKTIMAASNPSIVTGCITCIERILEECGDGLHADHSPLAHILLTLLSPHTASSTSSIRVLCLKSVNHLLSIDPDSIDMDSLLDSLSHCAVSEHGEERRLTCSCLSLLIDSVAEERMTPSKPAINSFMLRALDDRDEGVAMEACEYWNGCSERGIEEGELIVRLIPLLVKRVVYAEDDPEVLNLPQDGTDLRDGVYPRHHKAHAAKLDDYESDTEQETEGFSEWTLRKCAASTIDLLSSSCDASTFLQTLLPCCQDLLNTDSYLKKEAAILIIGAIAEGTGEEMEHHLDSLMPFLLRCMQLDSPPLVRSIAAWTVGRYHNYVFLRPELFKQAVAALSEMLIDGPFIKCRRAACSSLAVFAEARDISSVLQGIMPYITRALSAYSISTLPNLFDLVSSISTSSALPSDEHVSIIVQDLGSRFIQNENDQIIYPLIEALIALILVVDLSISQSVAPSLSSHSIILVERALNSQNENAGADSELAAAVLDLLGAIVRGAHYADQRLPSLVSSCLSSSDPLILQSTLALVGDISSTTPDFLVGNITNISQLLLVHFDPTDLNSEVASNAVWAWGAIVASELKSNLDALIISRAAQELCRCLLMPNLARSYYDNVVVSLGNTLGVIASTNANIDIDAAISRAVRLLSVNRDKDQRERASLGILNYLGSHNQLLSNHPADAIRIAICAGRNNPISLSLMQIVREKIVGMAGWEEWRSLNLPDIPAEHLL